MSQYTGTEKLENFPVNPSPAYNYVVIPEDIKGGVNYLIILKTWKSGRTVIL